MSILGVNDVLAGAYQYANRTQKTATSGASFTEQLLKTGEAAGTSKVDAYTEYLKSKYGKVTIQSIGKDRESLERAGKSMSGGEVVIAPNIFEEMANDPKKAAYYEQKIDNVFAKIPEYTAYAASQGLTFESCGVIVHEDGSVTHICGGGDSPEKVAKVAAENKAKREKKAAQRKANFERSRKAAEEQKEQIEIAYKKQSMAETLANRTMETSKITYTVTPEVMSSAIEAYENHIMGATGILE
ncbi:MAG: DUF6033 family protein [Clostridium sp.]|nr:DUF6033 family protein [Clostridium sp.]